MQSVHNWYYHWRWWLIWQPDLADLAGRSALQPPTFKLRVPQATRPPTFARQQHQKINARRCGSHVVCTMCPQRWASPNAARPSTSPGPNLHVPQPAHSTLHSAASTTSEDQYVLTWFALRGAHYVPPTLGIPQRFARHKSLVRKSNRFGEVDMACF